MESDKIQVLLDKYEDGHTSLAEEKLLQDYFTSGNVPAHLQEYRLLFSYTRRERTPSYEREINVGTRRRGFAFAGIAASIILAIGLFVSLNSGREELYQQDLGTIEDPEEAYYKAKETLQMISSVLNTGTEELAYIEEFDKAKNKYIKE